MHDESRREEERGDSCFVSTRLIVEALDFGRNFFPSGMNGNEISSNDHVRSVCLSLVLSQ